MRRYGFIIVLACGIGANGDVPE